MASSSSAMTDAADTELHPGELDAITLRLAQRGDRRALHRLIDHHAPAVFRLLSRMLGPAGHEHATEDLAQEAMVRVVSAIDRFDPNGPARLSTWVLTIASRLAIQHLQRRRLDTVCAHDTALATRDASPEATVSASELRRRVDEVVQRMSPPLRAAFLLVDAHGFTPGEVAEALEIPTTTARTRIHRARQQLRRALGEESLDD